MNSAKLRKFITQNSTDTNFRIRIDKGWTVDDGRGYATTKEEAVRRFDKVMKQVTGYKTAELYYDNEKGVEILVKKL